MAVQSMQEATPVLKLLRLAALLLASGLVLSACSGLPFRSNPAQDQADVYKPPTANPGTTSAPVLVLDSTSTAPPAPTLPAATPVCRNNLTYLEDLSIPDGSLVAPGSQMDKRWQVENSGGCNWDERYRLKLVAGPDLGAPGEQNLYPARSGTQATIRIAFTAPQEPGAYRSAWQAAAPNGEAFGDPIYIDIIVQGP